MQNKNNGEAGNQSQDNESINKMQDEFDSRLRAVLTEAEMTPPPDLFYQIEQKLQGVPSIGQPIKKERRWTYGISAAAAVVAVLGVFLWKFYIAAPANKGLQIVPGSLIAVRAATDKTDQNNIPKADIGQSSQKTDAAKVASSKPSMDGRTAVVRASEPQGRATLADKSAAGRSRIAESNPTNSGALAKNNEVVSSQTTDVAAGQGLGQNQVARIKPVATAQDANEAVTALKSTGVAATVVSEVHPKTAAAQIPPAEHMRGHAQQRGNAASATEPSSSATYALIRGGDKALQSEVAQATPRKKKGFLKGIFSHVKERVNEISESVVEEDPGKTTYNLGFVAITAYK